ncbi:MAG: hypothetical protein OWU33_16070, partial [Firmicutes bacterium]|nr:hypothetical protein [Bacillota bacterium]
GGIMNQEGGNRFDQEWSEMNKSIRTVEMFLTCFLVIGGMLVSREGTSQAAAQPAFVVTALAGSSTTSVTYSQDSAVYAAAVLYAEGSPFVVKGSGVWARLQVRGMMSVFGAAQLEEELLKEPSVRDARVLFFSDRADVLGRSASVIPRVVARLRAVPPSSRIPAMCVSFRFAPYPRVFVYPAPWPGPR